MERQYDDYADYMERRDYMNDGDGVSINIIVNWEEVWVNVTLLQKPTRHYVVYKAECFQSSIVIDAWSKDMAIALVNAFDEATAYEVYNQLKNE
jgi:hypothetical protein